MVTESTTDYEQHKKDIYEVISKKYGERRASKFLTFYANRYDSFGRSFIDYRLAWYLFDDYHYVRKHANKIYGFVGIGGQGKTTLMKNVLYFLDSNFRTENLAMDFPNFFKILSTYPLVDSMRAIGLDEPDDTYAFTSTEGKKIRQIMGKWRQQKLFVGICATDVSDIPPFFYRKLDVLFFLPYKGVGYSWRDIPKKKSYILQDLKNLYKEKKGYATFVEFTNTRKKPAGYLKFNTDATAASDLLQTKDYLKMKRDNYGSDLKDISEIFETKQLPANRNIRVNQYKSERCAYNLYSTGKFTIKKLSELYGLPDATMTDWIKRGRLVIEEEAKKPKKPIRVKRATEMVIRECPSSRDEKQTKEIVEMTNNERNTPRIS